MPPAWRHERTWVPARSALLLASPGDRHFERFRAWGGPSLDEYTRGLAVALAHELGGRAFLYCDAQDGAFADFVALGEAAGLGARSRLGLLLHPVWGPWWALRALLLVPEPLPATGPLAGFEPCTGCPAPCTAACPVAAPGPGGFDVGACGAHRRTGACASACDARRACPVGAEHAYGPAAEAWHQRAAAPR